MRPRRVVMVCYPGFELLDLSGPASVFGTADWLLKQGGYRVEIASREAGPVASSCGVSVVAERALAELRGAIDTLMVVGALGPALMAALPMAAALCPLARRAKRTTSVCSGAFLLAQAGLLRGRRATTHWAGVDQLRRLHPEVEVESDPIFVRDGNVWTSAGVTAGIDLALALVEEDHGARLALEVARWGVMYLRRPGGQSQFSAPLRTQATEDEAIAALLPWMDANLARDLSVEQLARRVHMSVRHFSRVFRRETGTTPARYVERLRIDAARRALELTRAPVKQIAAETGFGSTETLHRAFQRQLAVTPLAYRARFDVRERRRGTVAG